ncbi:hypothetical protein CAPTEDRAFT_193290 [Capitella teleta]|uniref:Uncharacterized protein n=1 Tax=Capitella teleta TaxID=283909 RepID=R7V1B0_CAPTE|nr:hypothetical protein CAPTEDRAFT_193290 [Capitella teleta]|eukprot:ELU09997.1 hypothetical protein CAPTEDRAFT_193290 [Capitella teleta]
MGIRNLRTIQWDTKGRIGGIRIEHQTLILIEHLSFNRCFAAFATSITYDICSEAPSRRSSRAISVDSRFDARRRQSSVCSALLQQEIDRRKSLGRDVDDIKGLPFELPGIQISRFETLDGGEGSVAGTISGSGCGSKKYIIIHNDVASDFSRLSCPSDYSLAGSTSRSRSRSSRASSGVSSRLWDFSPRESEWDADVSLGSRDSQLNVSKQDWGGGPSECGDCSASNTNIPRRMSVVTFDMSSPLRRHSSPASAGRRKDSGCECTCGKGPNHTPTEYPSVLKNRDNSCHALRYSDEMPLPTSSLRKKSADQSILSVRIDEDERELDVDETTPLRSAEVSTATPTSVGATAAPVGGATAAEKPCLRNHTSTDSSTVMTASAATETEHFCMERRDSRVLRPPLKRNNTDDSEVERRVAKLFKEIEFSVSDSVDESKINSQEYDSHIRRVEAQTQTMNEAEVQRMAESLNIIELVESSDQRRDSKASSAKSRLSIIRHDSSASFSDNQQVSVESSDLNLVPKAETRSPKAVKEKKSKLHALSNAIAHLGRRSSSTDSVKEKRLARAKNIPRRLLFHLGLSDDSVKSTDIEAGQVKSPPPTYEDVVNDNL